MNLEKFLKQEFTVLTKVRHQNVCEFFGVERSANRIYLIFELCDGGDLQQYLEKKGPLPESEVQSLFRQIAYAMIVFNREDCVHRDLKPANILLTAGGKIKVADFGLAR